MNRTKRQAKSLQARILSGSLVLLLGSGMAAAINFAYNVSVARFLGPTAFGHATAVYTLLTLISAVTLSFQIVPAKAVAQQSTAEGKAAAYRSFHGKAWVCGIGVALLLVAFQRGIAGFLKLPSVIPVDLIAIGAAFYVPLGSRRGYIQGAFGFRALATNLVLEGFIRLCGSLAMIGAGFGINGVIAANSAAIAVAYFAAAPKLPAVVPNQPASRYAFRESLQAMVFFAGQVLINNCDIVLVKHFFLPAEAGLYAAVAMVGRVVFAFSSAVVNSMFPLVAGTHESERKDLKVIATSLLLVFSIGSGIALALILTPASIWASFFGSGFVIHGRYGLSYLLSLYAITTMFYSLSVVMVTYEMSYKIANTSWVQLAFSGALIAGIYMFHGSLREVILVQLLLMMALLVTVALPFVYDLLSHKSVIDTSVAKRPLRLIRRVSEDEVIADFLKSDFNTSIFEAYQKDLRGIVMNPDLSSASENAKRRALLFIRHLALWKELPEGTEWYEVEIKVEDLDKIRVFPRAQWRNLARGDFSLVDIVEDMRKLVNTKEDPFLTKISSIGNRLGDDQENLGSVLFIGLEGSNTLTVLDGNHRLVASLLASPNRLHRLRFLCGLSPKMMECCWYRTSLSTLSRYARNMIKHIVYSPKAELAKLLQAG